MPKELAFKLGSFHRKTSRLCVAFFSFALGACQASPFPRCGEKDSIEQLEKYLIVNFPKDREALYDVSKKEIMKCPDDRLILRALFYSSMSLRKYDDMRSFFRRLDSMHAAKDREIEEMGYVALYNNNFADAVEYFSRLHRSSNKPIDLGILLAYAHALLGVGDNRHAITVLSEVKVPKRMSELEEAEYYEALVLSSQIYFSENEFSQAFTYSKDAISFNPDRREAYEVLLASVVKMDKPDRSDIDLAGCAYSYLVSHSSDSEMDAINDDVIALRELADDVDFNCRL